VRTFFRVIICALGLAVAAAAHAQAPARVTDVRITAAGEVTRVTVESDTKLNYNIFLLEAGSRRVVLDLPKVRWSVGGKTAESGSGKGAGPVSGFRYAHNTASTSRLVLDLSAPATVSRDFRQTGEGKGRHQIVLELAKASADQFASQVASRGDEVRPVAQIAARKPLIVIDPGHGGKDPGAIAASGLYEKDVTLGIAKALRDELLKNQKFDVALTRSSDSFLELEDRVTRARDLGADLFISLHADAAPSASTRGASVYTLSPEGEKRAETVRHKHDWIISVEADASRPAEVNDILADLVQRDTKNQSARFAQMLVPALAASGWPALENTHRRKGFFVLLSPDVPAVLLEMGFMSNAEDARMLTSETRRAKLVRSVAGAIETFFEQTPSLVAYR
jgi:N-acetylmuramoyl-L-alanine amidase